MAYVALGQGTSRAQAVSISAAAKLEQDSATNKVAMANAVVIDYANYGVRFGLKKQEKQDYGGQLIGPDGYEWVHVKGIKGCVLDAVFITQLCELGCSAEVIDGRSTKQQASSTCGQALVTNAHMHQPLLLVVIDLVVFLSDVTIDCCMLSFTTLI